MNGAIDTVSDPLSRTHDTDVDALGRVKQAIANATGTGVETATSAFTYDDRNNLTQVTDPKGLVTGYTYNGFDEVTQLASPDTGTATYGYDSAGNRISQLDARGILTGYTYDALSRLAGVDLPTDPDVAFLYDTPQSDCLTGETFGMGQLAKMTDGSGSTRYCYDRFGRVVRKVQTVTGGTTLTTGATYDGAGNLLAMTYPSGAIVTYLRNANGQVVQVDAMPTATATQVTLVDDVAYAPFGPVTAITFGNGRVQSRAYDQAYGIDTISESGGSDGYTADYGLNYNGNVTSVTERGTLSRTFEYDGQDRLKALKNTGVTQEAFTYDSTGNRLSKTVGGTTSNYTYASTSHRLTTSRTYDATGNTITQGLFTLPHDERGRLREFWISGVHHQSYVYNGKGERVLRIGVSNSANTLQFVYDEAGHLLGEYSSAGVRIAEYVWVGDLLVGVLKAHGTGNHQYVETDALGTPRAVINPATNTTVWRWDLTTTAFGDHVASTDPDANGVSYAFNLRYPGQYYNGLDFVSYNYYRDYDARTGRYLQSDPVGQAAGSSTYSYVSSSPLTLTDPLGLFEVITKFRRPDTSDFTKIAAAQRAFNATPIGKIEALLRKLGSELEADLSSRCALDQQSLSQFFENWTVEADLSLPLSIPGVNDGSHSRFGVALTNEERFRAQYFVFLHEFRHTMPGNQAMKNSNRYLRNFLSGKVDPIDAEADKWANRFLTTSCGCNSGKLRNYPHH